MDQHLPHVLVETLAWTLIHFLWQGALIASLLWMFLTALGTSTARVRCIVRCTALGLMGLAPLATFHWLWGEAPALPSLAAPAALVAADIAAPSTEALAYGQLTWICGLWLVGSLLCVLRISGGLLQVKRLRRRSSGAQLAAPWQRRFDQLARELAHIARNDYFVNIVQTIVESLLFYHPAVWWVSRGIRVEREYCCDDLAVAATHNGLAYAHALTALESWRGAQPQLGVSTLGGSLMDRIQRLIGVTTASNRKTFRPANALAGLLAACTLSASAFAFSALPEPAACDCKCACHEKQANSKKRHELPDGVKTQYQVHLSEVHEQRDEIDSGTRSNPLGNDPFLLRVALDRCAENKDEQQRHKYTLRLRGHAFVLHPRELEELPAQVTPVLEGVLLDVAPEIDERSGSLVLRGFLRTADSSSDVPRDGEARAPDSSEPVTIDYSALPADASRENRARVRALAGNAVRVQEHENRLKQELSDLRLRVAELERELDEDAKRAELLYRSLRGHE